MSRRTPSQYVSAALDGHIRLLYRQLVAARKYRDAHTQDWPASHAEGKRDQLVTLLQVRKDAREAAP